MPSDRPLVLPVKPYRPDLPAYGSGASVVVNNVLPRTKLSYGPLSSLSPYGAATLPSICMGAYAGSDPRGNVKIFAGTANDLYTLGAGEVTFTNASKSAGVYNVSDQWKFAIIKSRMLATNLSDPIQSYIMGTSSAFADLSAAAPRAKFIAGIKQWVMVAHTEDPLGGLAPWRVWWSAVNDATSWPDPGSDAAAASQSDYNDLAGENGAITGLVGNLGTSEGALFFEHAVWRIVYVGPPAVFDFFPAQGLKGTKAPNSIVQVGAYVYYLAEDGFYKFDGTNAQPIGANKVDKTFFRLLSQEFSTNVVGAADPVNKMIFWAFCSENNNGLLDTLLIYNWVTDEWSIGDVDCEFLFRSLGTGMTLETLDSLGYTLEDLPFSLDANVFLGGSLQLGAFDTSHRLAYFTGTPLEATVDCEEIQPFQGQRMFVRNVRPLVDGGTPSAMLGTRERLTDSVTYSVPITMNGLGTCPQRASARYVRGRIIMPAGSLFSHISGIELDGDPIGAR